MNLGTSTDVCAFLPQAQAVSLPAPAAAEPDARPSLEERRMVNLGWPGSRSIRAGYDASRTTTEFQNYWANADHFDADSAHSKAVRHTLISRSRYEAANNGYADGIAQTYATDVVGTGPKLRMLTRSKPFNQLVEFTWGLWAKSIKFRRKLWCMAHAKHVDGEAYAVIRRNPSVRSDIKLDIQLYEADQVQTPYVPFNDPYYIDGIKFDKFGNPLYYDVLHEHPGSNNSARLDLTPEQVPAYRMLHWFKMRRPGQHRGVPEMSSTLNTGAAGRRWREATIAAAESAADFSLIIKTQMTPDAIVDPVSPLSTMDIEKRTAMAMPMGWDPYQMKAEHPNATYEMFHKTLINEMARPKSMPFNKAACDSSSYNYASGRLDHQTYYSALDVDREDCNDDTLDPLFDVWFDYCVVLFGWLGGDPEAIGPAARNHMWDWPKHRVADLKSEAEANKTKLQTGEISLPQLYSESGRDIEDEITTWSAFFGVTEDELRKRLLDVTFPAQQQGGAPDPTSQPSPGSTDEAVAAIARQLVSRGGSLNGHANGNGKALNGHGGHHG